MVQRKPTGRFPGHVVPRGTLEVAVYEPPALRDSRSMERQVGSYSVLRTVLRASGCAESRVGVISAGVFTSFLLHALLISSLTLGWGHMRAYPPNHPHLNAPGVRSGQDDELTMELVPVEEAGSSAAGDAGVIATPMLVTVNPEAALADANVPPVLDLDGQHADVEAMTRSLLAGRYLGQVDARIERAWRRPRTPIREGLFSCGVRIEQDASGGCKRSCSNIATAIRAGSCLWCTPSSSLRLCLPLLIRLYSGGYCECISAQSLIL